MMLGIDRQAKCKVNRAEALRYLGYAEQTVAPGLAERIEHMLAHCEEIARPAWCYRVFPVEMAGGRAFLVGSALQFDVSGVLGRMSACAVMACTIGSVHDREERRLAASETTEALVFDAAGSSLVEECAAACERAIGAWANGAGFHAGQRTSPGYGELPLELSDGILRTLEAGKLLGMSMTASGLLVPQKSVTALVGLFDSEEDARLARRSCADCIAVRDCAYLKAGNPCNPSVTEL